MGYLRSQESPPYGLDNAATTEDEIVELINLTGIGSEFHTF